MSLQSSTNASLIIHYPSQPIASVSSPLVLIPSERRAAAADGSSSSYLYPVGEYRLTISLCGYPEINASSYIYLMSSFYEVPSITIATPTRALASADTSYTNVQYGDVVRVAVRVPYRWWCSGTIDSLTSGWQLQLWRRPRNDHVNRTLDRIIATFNE
jgi:hypothetical protein